MTAKGAPPTPVIRNKRAGFDYELGKAYEAGLSLVGSEVKSLRQGQGNLTDSWCSVDRGEAWIHGLEIAPMLGHAAFAHAPKRTRKLLLHRQEIEQIERAIERDGMTVTATKLYFKGGRAKLEIALARGKKKGDKRETLKRKEADKEARDAIGRKRKGV